VLLKRVIQVAGARICAFVTLAFAINFSTSVCAENRIHAVHSRPTLLFTYLDHPDAEKATDVLKRAYASIGVDTTFSATPDGRDSLTLLKKEMIDGDVARQSAFGQLFDDLIVVEPSIMDGQLFLVCSKGVECHRELVERDDILMLTNMPFDAIFRENNIKVMTGSYGTFNKNIEYLKLNRASYLLFGGTTSDKSRIDADFTVIPIVSFPLHHILHKRYSHLLPDLEQAINEQLNVQPKEGIAASTF